jgi:hypothetical protein
MNVVGHLTPAVRVWLHEGNGGLALADRLLDAQAEPGETTAEALRVLGCAADLAPGGQAVVIRGLAVPTRALAVVALREGLEGLRRYIEEVLP